MSFPLLLTVLCCPGERGQFWVVFTCFLSWELMEQQFQWSLYSTHCSSLWTVTCIMWISNERFFVYVWQRKGQQELKLKRRLKSLFNLGRRLFLNQWFYSLGVFLFVFFFLIKEQASEGYWCFGFFWTIWFLDLFGIFNFLKKYFLYFSCRY